MYVYVKLMLQETHQLSLATTLIEPSLILIDQRIQDIDTQALKTIAYRVRAMNRTLSHKLSQLQVFVRPKQVSQMSKLKAQLDKNKPVQNCR